MPVTYANTQRTARMQVVADALASGSLEITTSADAVLSTHTLAATAGTVTNGVLTFGAIGNGTASASGTASKARLKNSGGTIVASNLLVASTAMVGDTPTDIIVSSTTFNAGQTVQVTSLTITEGNS